MHYGNNKSVRHAVTHEWRHRRPQTGPVVINGFTLLDERGEYFLLVKITVQGAFDIGRIRWPKNFGRWKVAAAVRIDLPRQPPANQRRPVWRRAGHRPLPAGPRERLSKVDIKLV